MRLRAYFLTKTTNTFNKYHFEDFSEKRKNTKREAAAREMTEEAESCWEVGCEVG